VRFVDVCETYTTWKNAVVKKRSRKRGCRKSRTGGFETENRGIGESKDGDVEVDSEPEEEIEKEQDGEERDPTIRLISYLSNRGSSKVEVSRYDGILRVDVLIDWIGKIKRHFEYENV
jgi:hypothetical protein